MRFTGTPTRVYRVSGNILTSDLAVEVGDFTTCHLASTKNGDTESQLGTLTPAKHASDWVFPIIAPPITEYDIERGYVFVGYYNGKDTTKFWMLLECFHCRFPKIL